MSVYITTGKQPDHTSEQGFILIVTMLILVVLTALCIGALDSSTFEVQIAANDRQSRVAFNLADGGGFAASKLVNQIIMESSEPIPPYPDLHFDSMLNPEDPDYSPTKPLNDPNIDNITNNVGDFYDRVMGFKAFRDVVADGPYDFMLRIPGSNGDVFGRLESTDIKHTAGGGSEFGTGSSGVGSGSVAGIEVLYSLVIDAYAPRNARSQVALSYRKVLGTAGGL